MRRGRPIVEIGQQRIAISWYAWGQLMGLVNSDKNVEVADGAEVYREYFDIPMKSVNPQPNYWLINKNGAKTTPIHGAGFVWKYGQPKGFHICFYCGRKEKPEFPLTRKTLSFKNENGKWVDVYVCPICYYERWGFRTLKGRWAKNDNRFRFVKIQKTYVNSLKKVNPKRLAEIQEQLYAWIKREVARKFRDPKKQARKLNQLAKARIFP